MTDELNRIDTSLIRGVATALVVNSHMGNIYPRSELAGGGLLGLVLFFYCSGLGLALSHRTRTTAFPAWYGRRILRLYPTVLVGVVLFNLAIGGMWRVWMPADYLFHIYPTNLHFISKIVVYYVVIYFYVRGQSTWKHIAVLGTCIVACVLLSVPDIIRLSASSSKLETGTLNHYFLWTTFLLSTLLGVWFGEHKEKLLLKPIRRLDWLAFFATAICYATLKFCIAGMGVAVEAFLLLFVAGFAFSFFALRILSHPETVRWVKGRKVLWALGAGLGAISLEVYVVHSQILSWEVWKQFAFPVNFLLFILASIVLSLVVRKICKLLPHVS